MSTVSATPLDLPPPLPLRRFTVDEYHRLIREGIIKDIERTELLDGWIVSKMTGNPPHDVSLDKSQEALRSCLPAGWRLRVQSAISLSGSEPEPDIAVVAGPADRYLAGHPQPPDIAALIEISDSSLEEDRGAKLPIYARARIPVYWIVNLVEAKVEVYTDPTGPDSNPRYLTHRDFGIEDVVPFVIGGAPVGGIPVKDLLPASVTQSAIKQTAASPAPRSGRRSRSWWRRPCAPALPGRCSARSPDRIPGRDR